MCTQRRGSERLLDLLGTGIACDAQHLRHRGHTPHNSHAPRGAHVSHHSQYNTHKQPPAPPRSGLTRASCRRSRHHTHIVVAGCQRVIEPPAKRRRHRCDADSPRNKPACSSPTHGHETRCRSVWAPQHVVCATLHRWFLAAAHGAPVRTRSQRVGTAAALQLHLPAGHMHYKASQRAGDTAPNRSVLDCQPGASQVRA